VSTEPNVLARAAQAKLFRGERRSDPRVALEIRADILSKDFAGPLPARTRDLSIGGVCIATPSPIAVGSIRGVSVALSEQPLRLRAVGTWQRFHPTLGTILTGVRFDGVEPEAQDLLWEYISREGQQLARFFHRHVAIDELGIDGATGLAQVTRLCLLRTGDVVYRQAPGGSASNSIYIVQEGSIVLQVRINATRTQEFGVASRGELFGGLPGISSMEHEEFAVARSQARVLEIDERAFSYLSLSSPWLAQRLAAELTNTYARRVRAALTAVYASAR
jgi:hypothetical protein